MDGPSPKGSPWYCQAILLWFLILSPSFPPGWLFHIFPLLLPRPPSYPHFQLMPLRPFLTEKIASDCIKWMSTNSPATSTKLLKSELCSHLTVYGFAVLFQSQSLHLDLTSHSPFAFSQTLLQCFSFYCINNFSLSTESSPSAYKHIVIALILKKQKSCHPCLMEASAPFPPCWPQSFKIWFYPLSSVLLSQFLSISVLSKSGS